jgi:putative ABC transport system permease protein
MAARRVITATFIAFATMALVLCAIGLFATAAHEALARRTEFAIRVALGADRVNMLLRVLNGSINIMAAGLAVGSLLSFMAATALVAAGLAGASQTSLSIGVSLMLVTLVGIGSLIPAIRTAQNTDIPQTLRS